MATGRASADFIRNIPNARSIKSNDLVQLMEIIRDLYEKNDSVEYRNNVLGKC
jgi:proline dehydrogenase